MLRALLLSSQLTGPAAAAPVPAVDLLVFTTPGLFEANADGRIGGAGGALIERLAKLSGVALCIEVMPPSRVMQTLGQRPGSCAAGVPRLPEQEEQLHWLGLMASSTMMLYGRPDETRTVARPEDLRGAVIAAQRSSLPVAWLRRHGLQVQEVRDAMTGLRMLQARRVDYWLVNELVARHGLRQFGDAPPVRPLQSFERIEAHVACHRDTDPAVLASLRAAVEQLRRGGELVPFGVRD
jgi:polar amino acid transport system substrate-binding protein